MLDIFGDELKSLRLSKDLTLHQVARKTKIEYKFLEAMEMGDFEFLPELYVKSFLKEYLKALDADETIWIKKYEAARQGRPISDADLKTEEVKKPEKKEKEPVRSPFIKEPIKKEPVINQSDSAFDSINKYKRSEDLSSKKLRNKIFYYITAGALFIAAVLFLFFFDGNDDIVIPEKTWEEVIEDTSGNSDVVNDTPQINEYAAPVNETAIREDSLKLTIQTTDTSWIKITIDDSRTEEFILFPGSQKSMIAASNYKVIFGNTGGIKLNLNGNPLTFKSKSSVQRVQIDSSGMTEMKQGTTQ